MIRSVSRYGLPQNAGSGPTCLDICDQKSVSFVWRHDFVIKQTQKRSKVGLAKRALIENYADSRITRGALDSTLEFK